MSSSTRGFDNSWLGRAGADDANARRPNVYGFDAGRGYHGDVDPAQSLTGTTQRRARRRIVAGGQHTLSRRDSSQRLYAATAQCNSIDRQHGITAGGHRLADIDAPRGRRQRHRHVGTGVGEHGGFHAEAVAQCDRMRRQWPGDDILGQRAAECLPKLNLLRLDRARPACR